MSPALPHIGVTASRHGLTTLQIVALRIAMLHLKAIRGATTLHHGDCVNGDEAAAQHARLLGLHIVAHPPIISRLRARFPSDEERAPLHYLARDRQIVAETDALLGFPATDAPVAHSGTWYTIDQAVHADKPRLVVGPSGRVLQSVGIDGLWREMPGSGAGVADVAVADHVDDDALLDGGAA